MNYKNCEEYLSKPRIGKYKVACGGDEQKALRLYILNMEVSRKFHSVIGLFEVVLRNAIDKHYINHFNDKEWILNQIPENFFETRVVSSIVKEKEKLASVNSYSHDRLVSVMNFGFWAKMFFKHQFIRGDRTILAIFPNKAKGVNQKTIAEEIDKVKLLRNRISHCEPICFDKKGKISMVHARYILKLLNKYFYFLGIPKDVIELSDFSELYNLLRQSNIAKRLNG
ncbi:MAG: Abi family protein [Chitinivibrionia bacterium]|nr:Abi family protein [Chitinivibrionia bacterium]